MSDIRNLYKSHVNGDVVCFGTVMCRYVVPCNLIIKLAYKASSYL